jgi:hypothetical protein
MNTDKKQEVSSFLSVFIRGHIVIRQNPEDYIAADEHG